MHARHCFNVDLMLAHRLRRWAKIESALGERHAASPLL